jgi:gamma-glutamyltranspeptidase/glutathione hydrolase
LLANEAGAEAFARGGNALDAALAAATTLAVVYPHMCGIGGDLFALVHHPNDRVTAINASGKAPAEADAQSMRAEYGDRMPARGPATVTVPGAVSGWSLLHQLGGRLAWRDSFDRAVSAAGRGVPAARDLAATLAVDRDLFGEDPGLREIFFRDGAPIQEGTTFAQNALAQTLEAIAHQGPDALYKGEVGRDYVAGLRRRGVPITTDDLADHRALATIPISGSFRDLELLSAPPNSQGFVLLLGLALIEHVGLDPNPLGQDCAMVANAFRLASRERDLHLSDPDAMRTPVDRLLGAEHVDRLASELRASARLGFAGTRPASPSPAGDTIALVAADAEGWAVSLIQSLYYGFGSGILEPKTGIVAHDRGACFTLEPGHPNELSGGKRPAHTLMPVLIRREGRLAAVTGTMGAEAQPQINAWNLIRALELGLVPDEALAAPRWTVERTLPGDAPTILVEPDVNDETRARLEEGGFRLVIADRHRGAIGHSQMILVDPEGFQPASDPRADGGAFAG